MSLTHVKSPIKDLDVLPLDGCKWQKLCLAETQIRFYTNSVLSHADAKYRPNSQANVRYIRPRRKLYNL